MLKKVKITMLGGFSVMADDRCVIADAAKLTKPWQLFCFLVMQRGEVVSGAELMRLLWDDEDLADPANVLKNAVYALRREIAGKAKPGDGPILYRGGGYCINPHLEFDVDVFHFQALCDAALAPEETDLARMEACRTALAAYSGDFLPMAEGELWMAPFVRSCKRAYTAVARALCAALEQQAAWNELLTVSTRACLADPLDEACILYTFRAMAQLQMHRAIVATYSKTARFFEEETGQPLSAEIRRIYGVSAERVNRAEQDLAIIREDLQETLQEVRPTRGAYFCSYDVMKRMYPLLVRSAERSGQTLVLMLLTLQDSRRHVPAAAPLLQAMSDTRLAVNASLRKSDTFSRYSKHQYVLLLPVEKAEHVPLVESRIQENYRQTQSGAKVELSIRTLLLQEPQTK